VSHVHSGSETLHAVGKPRPLHRDAILVVTEIQAAAQGGVALIIIAVHNSESKFDSYDR